MNEIVNQDSFFYKLINHQVVQFFLSAGVALFVDVFIYFILVNFIFDNHKILLFGILHSPNNISLLISYSCGVVVNFLVTKYVVFNESNLSSNKQFIRFASIAAIGFFLNYALLRFFIEILDFYPTLSRILTALSLGIASFYIHKLFTFKVKEN